MFGASPREAYDTHTTFHHHTPHTGEPGDARRPAETCAQKLERVPLPASPPRFFLFSSSLFFFIFPKLLLPGWGGSCRNYSHKVYYGHSLYTVFIYRLPSVTVAITGFFYSFSRFIAALASSRVATLLSTNVLLFVVLWSGGVSCQSYRAFKPKIEPAGLPLFV